MKRILFTADLHLGRSLHGVSLLEDQRHILNCLLGQLRDHNAETLIIGGDLFDRSIPSSEAISLADWFFERCVEELKIRVVVIAGNHDSPERLDFAAGLLARQGLHIVGSFPERPEPIRLEEPGSPLVAVWAIPYVEPGTLHHHLERLGVGGLGGELHDHQHAWARLVPWLDGLCPAQEGGLRILVAHLLTLGGAESESERPLSIGGAQSINAELFGTFDLTLLGHLHRPQETRPGVVYAGSPLCYSASELEQEKSSLLISYDPDKPAASLACRRLPLVPLRPFKRLKGSLADLLQGQSEDYLFISLSDPLPAPDAFARLQKRYPRLLQVERELPEIEGGPTQPGLAQRREAMAAGDLALIASFIQEMTGAEPPAGWLALAREVLEEQRLAAADRRAP